MLFTNKKTLKRIALVLAINILAETLFPTVAFALTSGPSAPEFSSFEPVATTEMVNVFSGDLNYNLPVLNIPGPDGAGYSMSLSYHSGTSSEEEASWVGHGWTLNPGSINRDLRGFPDEYNSSSVTYYNKTRPNWSAGYTDDLGIEAMSVDAHPTFGINASTSLRFNNFYGFVRSYGVGIDVMGMASLGVNFSAQGITYSASVNPAGVLSRFKKGNKDGDDKQKKDKAANKKETQDNKTKQKSNKKNKSILKRSLNASLKNLKDKVKGAISQDIGSAFGLFSFSDAARATTMNEYVGFSYNWSTSIQANPSPVPVGFQYGQSGNFNMQTNIQVKNKNTYGYMYNPGGILSDGVSDYYVEKGSTYDKRDYFIGIPFSNADNFNVNGEGLTGGFRFYPTNLGHFYPDQTTSSTNIRQTGLEYMLGDNIGIGLDLGVGHDHLTSQTWNNGGNAANYSYTTTGAPNGFFRFNGDMGGKVEYSSSVGVENAQLVTISDVPGLKDGSPNFPTSNQTLYTTVNNTGSSGMSSCIQYHSNNDLAPSPGLGKTPFNQTSTQGSFTTVSGTNSAATGIAEFSIYNEDGNQYVYGLPTYVRNDANLQFDAKPNDPLDPNNVATINNNYTAYKNIGYVAGNSANINSLPNSTTIASITIIPDITNTTTTSTLVGEVRKEPYAASHLLTQILTSDYVDVTGNGITSDDFGGWTQFKYYQAYGGSSSWYRYRTPYKGLSYNINQLSDPSDDVGNMTSGEKEVYFLKVIETKTHIAFFVTNKTQPSRFSDITNPNVGQYNASYLTGTSNPRYDGYSASSALASSTLGGTSPFYEYSSTVAAQYSGPDNTSNSLEYLEKIVLFAKSRPDQPIKTVNFGYAHQQGFSQQTLVQNLPNNSLYTNANPLNPNIQNAPPTDTRSGKLTLEKVWFDYEGTINARVSPYVFKYVYKTIAEFQGASYSNILTQYPAFNTLINEYAFEGQNPSYDPELLDAWGNVQYDGQQQHADMRPWLYQGPLPTYNPNSTLPSQLAFDPAAWQLKQIQLPSGGQILIEYEQKDYCYVQDRPAMAMASLSQVNDGYGGDGTNNSPYPNTNIVDNSTINGISCQNFPTYSINSSDLGITTSTGRDSLIKQITNYYTQNPKLYFKFLYALTGSSPSLSSLQSEYITGYCNFIRAWADPTDPNNLNIVITVDGSYSVGSSNDRTIAPRQACYDFAANQRVGKIFEQQSNDPAIGETSYEQNYEHQIVALANTQPQPTDADAQSTLRGMSIVKNVIKDVKANLQNSSAYPIPAKPSVCIAMQPNLSYLKLPMYTAKRGGGVRVKRIYMLDNGIESGDVALYGTEYIYQTQQGTSSGVASNEPSTMREENPLVTFLPKKTQSWFSRITAGEEKDDTEGPLGESILPGPLVGHSRVVVRNIKGGYTGTGYTVHEFYTTKDYPFDKVYNYSSYSSADPTRSFENLSGRGVDMSLLSSNTLADKLNISAGLFAYTVNKVWLTQGFRFIINNMNGQVKRVSAYGGDYYALVNNVRVLNPDAYLVSMQEYTYFEPGEKVNVMQSDGTVVQDTPGKEMDMTMQMQYLKDKTTDINIEIDISIAIDIPPPVFFTLFPSIQLSENGLSTHSTSKVVNYPAIVKKVVNYNDGIYSYSENLAFDGATGQPMLTRTADGYDQVLIGTAPSGTPHDGSIYSLSLPAFWYYSAMGQKAINSSNTNQLSASAGGIVSYAANPLITSTSNPIPTNWSFPLQNLLSAHIQTFSNSNTYNKNSGNNNAPWMDLTVQNDYGGPLSQTASNLLGQVWRPSATYEYKTGTLSSNTLSSTTPIAITGKVYNGGIFSIPTSSNPLPAYTLFDYGSELRGAMPPASWLRTNQITQYSPNGNSLEDVNILGIYSSTKFGYTNTLPVMIVQNAQYGTFGFEDFENSNSATTAIAHSGARSLQYASNSNALLNNLNVSSQLIQQGGLLRLWLNSTSSAGPQTPQALVAGTMVPFTQVAQTGNWTLFSATIPASAFTSVISPFSINLNYPLASGEIVYIDDVRFEPYDSKSSCYVYDVGTLRLLVQFDDQHFGLYYQYNMEGKLVRKLVETEEGIKTVQETQYNIPRTNRTP